MSKTKWDRFMALGSEINDCLRKGVLAGIRPESEMAEEIFALHREWLMKVWPSYTGAMHKGAAAMYTADERFTQYYDKEVLGCAKLLKEIIDYWADRAEADGK